jgi:hypothetical protein
MNGLRQLAIRCLTALLIVTGATVAPGEESNQETVVRVTVNLKDGSRIKGEVTPPYRPLDVSSPVIGKLSIPLPKIAAVTFGADHKEAAIRLRNGDKLQGLVELRALKMKTLVGELSIPMEAVSLLEVRTAAGAAGVRLEPEDWDILPFATDSDWPGPKGERAKFENDDILLAGQPVRSRNTFTVPTTVECDVTFEDRDTPDAGFFIRFVQPDQPKDLDPTRGVDVTFGHDGGRAQLLVVALEGFSHGDVVWKKPISALKTGERYHLRVHAHADGLRIELNDTVYEVNDQRARVPDGKFQIQLSSWRPGMQWRVKDFAVH